MEKFFLPEDHKAGLPLINYSKKAIPIFVTNRIEGLVNFLSKEQISFASNLGFFNEECGKVILSSAKGMVSAILLSDKEKTLFKIGSEISKLPTGEYYIANKITEDLAFEIVMGFCLEIYKFEKYITRKRSINVKLCLPKNLQKVKIYAFLGSEFFVRDLINSPANFLNPDTFASIISQFCKAQKLKLNTVVGNDLITQNFPLIFEVGKASSYEPRLLDFSWGDPKSLKVTLVGKGVCFDTGGLNIKSGSSMSIMKKDMGGAASVLGLASIIINMKLNVRLRVLIPIVENSLSAKSFRPGDILKSRKGYTVEVNNTDAEGRLVLADALDYATEESPNLLISMATLTGSARIALGPDIVPFYTTSETFAHLLIRGGESSFDPVWQMPFYKPYETLIEPDVADLDNAPKTGMAGSITAALFLKRFTENAKIFSHFDIYGWSQTSRPGRQRGGLMQGSRAIFEAINQMLLKSKKS